MHSSVKTFIDFDCTLVQQNSTDVLIRKLLSQAETPAQRALAAALTAPSGWFLRKGLGAATWIAEKDVKLMLVMHVFAGQLERGNFRIYRDVASELVLNPDLNGHLHRRFVILSVGLQPIIDEFLKFHPGLQCLGIVASEVHYRAGRPRLVLENIQHKVGHLTGAGQFAYYTDYEHEAKAFQAAIDRDTSITKIPLASRKPLYLLESQS